MRYTFREIRQVAQKRFTCGCGRRLVRRKTFDQTINPWNTDAEGRPKTAGQIWRELSAEADEWRLRVVRTPCTHDKDAKRGE